MQSQSTRLTVRMVLTPTGQELSEVHTTRQRLVERVRRILDLGILNRVNRTTRKHRGYVAGIAFIKRRIVLFLTRLITKFRTSSAAPTDTTAGTATATSTTRRR